MVCFFVVKISLGNIFVRDFKCIFCKSNALSRAYSIFCGKVFSLNFVGQ